MKKVYVNPVTECYHVITAVPLAASPEDPSHLFDPDWDVNDSGGVDNGNLSKGGSIWDAWD